MSKFTAGYSWFLNFMPLNLSYYLLIQICINMLDLVAQNNEGGKNNFIVCCCLWHAAIVTLICDYNSLKTRKGFLALPKFIFILFYLHKGNCILKALVHNFCTLKSR